MIIETRSAKETYDLGKKIGSQAKAGEVYTLVGDLGVGKTVFTQGLAKGLGIEEPELFIKPCKCFTFLHNTKCCNISTFSLFSPSLLNF